MADISWRRIVRWLLRSALFVVVAAVGFVVVFAVGAAYPEQTADIYLWGGIIAWGIANWVDSAVFDGGRIAVNDVNRMLDERRERFTEIVDDIYRAEEKARKDLERLHYLRGVNDAALHPERVKAVIVELKAEEVARAAAEGCASSN